MGVKGKVRHANRGEHGAREYQFVVFDDKTGQAIKTGDWVKKEDTATNQLDKALEAAKKKQPANGGRRGTTPDEPLRQQGADDVPPGGQNTGPR